MRFACAECHYLQRCHFLKIYFQKMRLFLIYKRRKLWSAFEVTLVCTQRCLLWKNGLPKNDSLTNRHTHKTHIWTLLNLQRKQSGKHNWVCIGLFLWCLLLSRGKQEGFFTYILPVYLKKIFYHFNSISILQNVFSHYF